MELSAIMPALLAIPLLAAAICLVISNPRAVLRFAAGTTVAILVLAVWAAFSVVTSGEPAGAADSALRVDALSAYHLVVMALVFVASSIFAVQYFEPAIADGKLSARRIQRFGALWLASLSAMTLVLTSNNMGLMWVGMEATTVSTAFLIALHSGGHELEAMWKYLIVCSVGIAFAFMGTLLSAAAVPLDATRGADALLWTHLMAARGQLDPTLMRVAFVFLLVGYGTKAGLAPMHTWLPDAHSQAPAPVSAMFSGFMLNSAMYCIIRYLPLINGAAPGFGTDLLLLFGILSIVLSAAFIIFQTDAKRLLAYHSVEHLGIIALGFSLGPAGTQAALFHTLNHSVCKSLGFFAVGRLGQSYGSHDMHKIQGAMVRYPIWGVGLFGSMLALIGVAPFAIFMSEFQLLHAAVDRGAWIALVLFLVASSVVFVAALKHAIDMAFGQPAENLPAGRRSSSSVLLVTGALGLLLWVGMWMPASLHDILGKAASVLGGIT